METVPSEYGPTCDTYLWLQVESSYYAGTFGTNSSSELYCCSREPEKAHEKYEFPIKIFAFAQTGFNTYIFRKIIYSLAVNLVTFN
jgi:hypothetical protein